MDLKYNGWTNYPTWRVNLEIFEDIDSEYWEDQIEDGCTNYELGEHLEEYAESLLEADNELAESYALAFMNEVNWSEIAKHIIDTYRENYCCHNCNERLDERFTSRYCSFKCQKEDEILADHPKG